MNLYKLYFKYSRKWMLKPTFSNSLQFKIISRLTQFYLNNIYKQQLKRCNNTLLKTHKEQEIIVSLTTFPARINTVWITIETIFQQEYLPDRVILWLAKEQFPQGITKLPVSLKKQMKRGLEIRFCDDLKSHKKYYYSMLENPNAIIITIDDDVFYPTDTIKNLISLHEQYPKDIIAHSAQEIPDDISIPPSKWKTPHFRHINNIFAKCRILGISGILYPPHSLHNDAFNHNLRKKLCPWADDLWLTIMAYINETQIRRYEFRSNPLDVKGTQAFNLSRGSNMGYSVTRGLTNDDQWINLIKYYQDKINDIIKKKRIDIYFK